MLLKKGSTGNDVVLLQRALHLFADGIFGTLTCEAVKQFQKENGLQVDGIVGDKTWHLLFSSNEKIALERSTRKITEIIVHCSATPEGANYTVADITRWHKARHFTTIGYHYVIYIDGSLHKGRNINIAGAHCENHNRNSIGICYIGGCANDGKLTPKDTRTPKQKETLLKLLKDLKQLYPNAKIRGHRDFANKACPSFDATREYSRI